jgi:hypothetical protein
MLQRFKNAAGRNQELTSLANAIITTANQRLGKLNNVRQAANVVQKS